jgi:hypothetical protein
MILRKFKPWTTEQQPTTSPWNIHRAFTTCFMSSVPYCQYYMVAKQINFGHRMSLFVTERAWQVLLFLQCAYAIVCIKASLMLVMRGGNSWTGGVYKLAIQPMLYGIATGDTRRNYQTEYSITSRRERKRWVCVCRTSQNWKYFVKQEWPSDWLTEKNTNNINKWANFLDSPYSFVTYLTYLTYLTSD